MANNPEMTEEVRLILKRVFPGINVENMPHSEPVGMGRFPCERCGGTGWITVYHNMQPMKMRCPMCRAERDKAELLAKSGVNLEDYNRFTIESFRADTPEAEMMKSAAVQYLRGHNWKKGLGFFGASGTGKTHICIAVLQAMGTPHRYWEYRHEIQPIKAFMYHDNEKYEALINEAAKAENLYIDDLFQGAWLHGELSQMDNQIMFEIINRRYLNKMPTFFSSNSTMSQMRAANEALASRIYDMTAPYTIEVHGANRRFQV